MAALTKPQVTYYLVLATSNILKKNLEKGPFDPKSNPQGFPAAGHTNTGKLWKKIPMADRKAVTDAVGSGTPLDKALATSRTFFDNPDLWGDAWAEGFAGSLASTLPDGKKRG